MEYVELDKKLQALTESEKRHKEKPFTSEIYNSMEQVNVNGKPTYVFNFDEAFQQGKFLINKHTRFSEVPMHIHTHIELNYIYSGQCTQIINDKEIILREGQVCIVDTGVPHAVLATTENDIIINFLMSKEYFSTAFLSRLSGKGIISEFLINALSDRKEHDNYIIFNSENNKKLPKHIRELLCEYFDKSLYSDEIIDCYMILIFTELMRVFQYETNQSQATSNRNATIIDILQYLEENYMTCTLASTSSHFNFHPNYLSSLIKKSTNKSFKELIQAQKLTQASILLTNSDLPIYEIANNIGYENLNFFYKKFKSYFDVTPNEFREKHKTFNQ